LWHPLFWGGDWHPEPKKLEFKLPRQSVSGLNRLKHEPRAAVTPTAIRLAMLPLPRGGTAGCEKTANGGADMCRC